MSAGVLTLRCYCCAVPVTDAIALVSYSDVADRVFVFLPKCSERADINARVLIVTKEGDG